MDFENTANGLLNKLASETNQQAKRKRNSRIKKYEVQKNTAVNLPTEQMVEQIKKLNQESESPPSKIDRLRESLDKD